MTPAPTTTILVLDDDQPLCLAVAETLTKAGYDACAVFSGREALRRIEIDPVDVVVTDIFMPDCDGLEVISRLRSHFPAIRIVAMTGHEHVGRIDYLETAKHFGATFVLMKPFRTVELLNAVAACSHNET